MSDLTDDKKAARARLKAARASLSPDERSAQSRLAAIGVLKSGLLMYADTVALYAAFGDEADPIRIEEACQRRGIKTAYPRVEDDRLVFHLSSRAELKRGAWRIPEPLETAPLAEDIGLVVVPGLAFTEKGHRIGYGRGFYDRFLSSREARTIGFCFESQIVDALPTEDHDEVMNAVAAGSRLIWIKP